MSAPTMNGKAVDVLAEEVRTVIAETGTVPSENELIRAHGVARPKAKQVRARALTGTVKTPAKRAPKRAAVAPDVVRERAAVAAQAGDAIAHVETVVTRLPETASSPGRAWAWTAFLLGSVASLAANVAHAQPHLGPRLTAAFAPLALVLAVELAARVRWQPGWQSAVMRWGGTGLVAAVTAVVSYRTQVDLFTQYGEDAVNATILPLSVDGLMLVAAGALLTLGRRNP